MFPAISRPRTAIAAGAAAAALLALVHAAGYARAAGEEGFFWAVPLISLGTGAVLAILIDRKRDIWAFCLALGAVIGLYSAADLYLGPSMEMEYEVGMLTSAVFMVLGFAFGAFGEIVYALHRLAHLLSEPRPEDGPRPLKPPKD